MDSLYAHMKRMLPVSEFVGKVKEVELNENWCGLYDRVAISGKTSDGRIFEMTLEVKKEEKKDA